MGNICRVCDERIQIFHHLDDAGHDSGSDIEIDVVDATNNTLPNRIMVNNLSNNSGSSQRPRPDTPVIVDDDDMLYNLFMQKVDQQRQLKTQLQQQQHVQQTLPLTLPHQQQLNQQHQLPLLQTQQHQLRLQQQYQSQQQHQLRMQQTQQFVSQFQSPYTPPQSTAGGSEGDESKVIEVLTSRESTPSSSVQTPVGMTAPGIIDKQGHRIVAIIDLDDGDDNEAKSNDDMLRNSIEKETGLLTPSTNSSNDLSLLETAPEKERGLLTPIKDFVQTNNVISSAVHKLPPNEDDDEEIIFRKVEPEQTPPSSSTKKRKRKSYDEKQLRLVASLSLLSSDSESEDSPTKSATKKPLITSSTSNTSISPKKANVNLQQSTFSCHDCNIILPDAESLSVHERIHQGVKCPVCQFGFQQAQRLIHHMRRKHREYNGDVLSEKPRIGQDSCMTIRLRYMQRTTYYECQLCGRIDSIFREHKEHIMDKHPIESKSLKDPMMKQLKCPVCKEKCGAQYLSLCRHLITSHEYPEYKGHLRELVHVSSFGWNEARQEEVAKTAKIYQFIKRKTFFFECKLCQKVVAGYLHHLRHLNQHETPTKLKTKNNATTTSVEKPPILKLTQTSTTTTSSLTTSAMSSSTKNNTTLKKLPAKSEKIKEKTRKFKLKENSITKFKNKIDTKNSQNLKKSLKLDKSPKISNSEIAIKKRKRTTTPPTPTESVKKLKRNSTEAVAKLKINPKLKPKDKRKLSNTSSAAALTVTTPKATKGRPKKDTITKRKLKESLQIKKVKVKPPVKQIDLQKYKCRYCLKKFKGFRLFNLHLLKQHNENDEYNTCTKCNKMYSLPLHYQQHIIQCSQDYKTNKEKRKFIKNSTKTDNNCSQITDINNKFVKNPLKPHDNCSEIIEITDSCESFNMENSSNCSEDRQWLKDLLNLKLTSKTDVSKLSSSSSSNLHLTETTTNTALIIPQNLNLPCCYCLHLFACQDDLDQHVTEQHQHHHLQSSHKPEILIKYKPLKC